jgi:hypothetical protein
MRRLRHEDQEVDVVAAAISQQTTGDGPEEVGWSVRMLRTRAAVCNDDGHMLYLPALITCPAI